MNCSIYKLTKRQLVSFLGLNFFFKATYNFDGRLHGPGIQHNSEIYAQWTDQPEVRTTLIQLGV